MKKLLALTAALPRRTVSALRRLAKRGKKDEDATTPSDAPAELPTMPLATGRGFDDDEEETEEEIAAARAERRAKRIKLIKKWGLRGGGVALVLIGLIHIAMWAVMTSAAKKQVAAWIERENAEGRKVEVSAIEYGGFPLHIEARLRDYRLVLFGGKVIWTGEMAVGRGSVWSPSQLEVSLPSPQRIEIFIDDTHSIVDFEPEESAIAVNLDNAAGPSVQGSLTKVHITAGGETLTANTVRINAAPRKAQRRSDTRLALSLSLSGGVFDSYYRGPFGRVIRSAGIEAKLKGPFGTGDLGQEFSAWRRAGGSLTLERARLHWGPLDMTADGRLALDRYHRAAGAFNVHIKGFKDTMTALVEAGVLKPQAATWAKVAMSSSAVRRGLGDRAHLAATLPLTLKENVIRAGPAPLVSLPDLAFR